MLMTELLPRFKDFYAQEILPRKFDYLVPIETKGMLLLEEIVKDGPKHSAEILGRRAFDFMTPESLKSKRIALIDDLLVYGKAINESRKKLLESGVQEVSKFVFLLLEDERSRKYRRIEDAIFCTAHDKLDFFLMIEEFSQLTLRDRPTSPDHLVLQVNFKNRLPFEWVLNFCMEHGDVVEYRSKNKHKMLSVHYPDFSPTLPDYALDSGVNKLRVKVGTSCTWIELCPEFFPAINYNKINGNLDSWSQSLKNLLDRPWQTADTRSKNLFESVSLSYRTALCSRFLSLLRSEGIKIDNISVGNSRFPMYYGKELSTQIEKLIEDRVRSEYFEDFELGKSKSATDFEPFSTIDLTEELLHLFLNEYANHNKNEPNPYKWESVGLDIENLSRLTSRPKSLVSMGVEQLNDYGYSVPLYTVTNSNGTQYLSRNYRSTEVGEARLKT